MALDPADPRRGDGDSLLPPAADDIDMLLEAVCAGGRGPADDEGAPRRPGVSASAHQSLGVSGVRVGRVVGRWIAPPMLAFGVGIATAIWGLQTPEPSHASLATTPTGAAPTAPMELPSLFTLRWTEMRAAIERSMVEATLDQIARATDSDGDRRISARPTVTREEVQARRAAPGAALARELQAATLPPRQVLQLDRPPVVAEPVMSVTIAPPVTPPVADAVPTLESVPPSTAIASGDRSAPTPAEAAPTEVVARTAVDDEEQAVWRTLTRYVAAFEQMNVGATVAIWPSVDRRELSRAFGALKSQAVAFDACDVDVQRTMATARCSGTVRFVPRVGGNDPRVAQQAWLFSMRKSGRDWTIDEVNASRLADGSARRQGS